MMFPTIMQGKLITPIAPDAKVDWVSPRDIGRFAAEAFTRTETFNQKELAIIGDKLTMSEVVKKLSTVTSKRFEFKSVSVEESAALGLFDGVAQSYIWMNVEGYKVDPPEAACYGIQPHSLKSFLEENKSFLQETYSGVE